MSSKKGGKRRALPLNTAIANNDDDDDDNTDSDDDGDHNVTAPVAIDVKNEGEGEEEGDVEDTKDRKSDDEDDDDEEVAEAKAAASRRLAAKAKTRGARGSRGGRGGRGGARTQRATGAATKGRKSAKSMADRDGSSSAPKRPARLSAATLKTRMSPAMLQNPIARRKIWANLMQMMVKRGYEWVSDKTAPTDEEQLWPNNKGFLGFFHMHAVDKSTDEKTKREPVHVIFCSKAGEPTLKSLQYPSRHIILVSDSLTGRCRGALSILNTKAPPLANSKPAPADIDDAGTSTTATATCTRSPNEIGSLASSGGAATSASTAAAAPAGAAVVVGSGIVLKDVYVEAFVSTCFMFDLLKQRYLKVVQFSSADPVEMEKVYDAYERKRDLTRFPKMIDTDPVVRYLRLPIGSVIKQTRLSTASAIHQSYRVIVRANTDYKTSS